ncbi:MAG: VOC family protein [Candidatus Omnitrophica bacterium]|nr:VOC family protein [Candidatus Omnitrophota bacterium]
MAKPTQIECVIATLKVQSIASSIEFYSRLLGFTKDWEYMQDGYSMAGISRDGQSIYLSEGKEGTQAGWLWIGLEDDSIFDRILSSGVKVIQEPTNFPYAYEMRVEDPDGHILQLGTEPKGQESP